MKRIALVAFDADDTLWRSQEYFDEAQAQFEAIMASYIDLDRTDVSARLYATSESCVWESQSSNIPSICCPAFAKS